MPNHRAPIKLICQLRHSQQFDFLATPENVFSITQVHDSKTSRLGDTSNAVLGTVMSSPPLQKRTILNPGLNPNGFGLIAIAIAAALWAIAAIVAKQLFEAGVSPFELAMARAVIAALGLAVVDYLWQPSRSLITWRILILGLSLALVTASYYVAIQHLSVAVAVVIQYTAPALVVIFEAWRSRRLPPLITAIAVVMALLGVALVSGIGNHQLQVSAVGLVAAGLSAIFFSSYTLLSEALVNTYSAIGVMFRGFLVSSLFWLAVQIPQGIPAAIFSAQNGLGILFVGIGGTLIPFCLLCWGIQQVRAERGAITATLEPVIAALLAWLWLGQTLSWSQLLGGGLVLAAVVSLQLHQRQ